MLFGPVIYMLDIVVFLFFLFPASAVEVKFSDKDLQVVVGGFSNVKLTSRYKRLNRISYTNP